MTNTEYIISCGNGIYLVDVNTNTKKFFEMDVLALAKRVNQRTLLLEKCYPNATVIVLFDIRTGVETNVLETAKTPYKIPPRLVYGNCYYFLNPNNQVEVINLDTKQQESFSSSEVSRSYCCLEIKSLLAFLISIALFIAVVDSSC
jgi:hypothetical protein